MSKEVNKQIENLEAKKLAVKDPKLKRDIEEKIQTLKYNQSVTK